MKIKFALIPLILFVSSCETSLDLSGRTYVEEWSCLGLNNESQPCENKLIFNSATQVDYYVWSGDSVNIEEESYTISDNTLTIANGEDVAFVDNKLIFKISDDGKTLTNISKENSERVFKLEEVQKSKE